MMGLRKRRGVTILEIILALAILGIVATAVFNTIYFSLKTNKISEIKQKCSVMGDMTQEELKNLPYDSFEGMLVSLKEGTSYQFMDEEFEDVTDMSEKEQFKNSGEEANMFKLFKHRKSGKYYVKLSFKDIDFGQDSYGLIKNHVTSGQSTEYAEWAPLEECHGSVTFTKEAVDYSITIRKKEETLKVYSGMKEEEMGIKMINEDGNFVIELKERIGVDIYTGIGDTEIFLDNRAGIEIPVTILNKGDSGAVRIYSQIQSQDESEKISITEFGDNINIFINRGNDNPWGKSIDIDEMCEYKVEIFWKNSEKIKKENSFEGVKKFKRFKR